MKDMFERVCKNYILESKNDLKNNRLAEYIRNDIPQTIYKELQLNESSYFIKASPGQGGWSNIPWIGIFARDISISAAKGYDIVYLFCADMSGVYLSLNQGWTYFKERYGSRIGKQNIQKVSTSWKKILSSSLNNFSFEPIDLKYNGNASDLPLGYELGHICGKFYNASALPSDQVFIDDLRSMLAILQELKGKMCDLSIQNTNDYILARDKIGGFFEFEDKTDPLNSLIVDTSCLTLALKKPQDLKLKTNKTISKKSGKKVNFIKKQIRDTKLGLIGELMVLEYEKERLESIGRSDLIKYIKHISKEEGDKAGFDILSFDKNGSKIYIEVKTTTVAEDTPFFISQNELDFSKKNSINYYLYRVYNLSAKKKSASFYIVKGNLFETFQFNPVHYVSASIDRVI